MGKKEGRAREGSVPPEVSLFSLYFALAWLSSTLVLIHSWEAAEARYRELWKGVYAAIKEVATRRNPGYGVLYM